MILGILLIKQKGRKMKKNNLHLWYSFVIFSLTISLFVIDFIFLENNENN